jgi:uncharacterized protein YuzE
MAKEMIAANIPKDKTLDIDYDEEGDVLYLSFGKPQAADESEEINDVIYRFKGNELIGITIPSFKLRTGRTGLPRTGFPPSGLRGLTHKTRSH